MSKGGFLTTQKLVKKLGKTERTTRGCTKQSKIDAGIANGRYAIGKSKRHDYLDRDVLLVKTQR